MTKPDLLQMIADAEKQHKAKKPSAPVLEPKTDPVLVVVPGLSQLLEQTRDFLKHYVVFETKSQPVAISLWVAHTHLLGAADFTPYLSITAPSKKSGKTTVLKCLLLLVPKPWYMIQPSEAVLYRKIEKDGPTLLLDEADALFSNKAADKTEPIRAMLNAGFERDAAIPRCFGVLHDIRDFKVFCPKAIVSIGELPDTIRDRSVLIRLLAKAKGDNSVQGFRKREATALAAPIKAGFEAISGDEKLIESLRNARPTIPEQLNDRQADICEPLLAIADVAKDKWPERGRHALIELCATQQEDQDLGMKLLHDIKAIFESNETKRLATRELLQGLVDIDTDGPWPHWWEKDLEDDRIKGPASKLARLLKQFHLKSTTFRQEDGSTAKGYVIEDFRVLFERYLT
jgi:hypothetical protein